MAKESKFSLSSNELSKKVILTYSEILLASKKEKQASKKLKEEAKKK